jgi:hypothetical protein
MQLILMFRTIIARKLVIPLHCPLGNTALHTRSVGASARRSGRLLKTGGV